MLLSLCNVTGVFNFPKAGEKKAKNSPGRMDWDQEVPSGHTLHQVFLDAVATLQRAEQQLNPGNVRREMEKVACCSLKGLNDDHVKYRLRQHVTETATPTAAAAALPSAQALSAGKDHEEQTHNGCGKVGVAFGFFCG